MRHFVVVLCLLVAILALSTVEARHRHHRHVAVHRAPVHRHVHVSKQVRAQRLVAAACRSIPKPEPWVTCSFWGDPHYTSWKGQTYDHHPVGDAVVVAERDGPWAVHARHFHWAFSGAVPTVATAIAVALNTHVSIEYDAPIQQFRKNGNIWNPTIGKVYNFGGKASFKRTSQLAYEITAYNGAKTTVTNAGGSMPYLNVVISAPMHVATKLQNSICGSYHGGDRVTIQAFNLFTTPYDPMQVHYSSHPITKTQKDRQEAYKACSKLSGHAFKTCVFDYQHTPQTHRHKCAKAVVRAHKKRATVIRKIIIKVNRAKKVYIKRVNKAIKKVIRKHPNLKKQCKKAAKKTIKRVIKKVVIRVTKTGVKSQDRKIKKLVKKIRVADKHPKKCRRIIWYKNNKKPRRPTHRGPREPRRPRHPRRSPRKCKRIIFIKPKPHTPINRVPRRPHRPTRRPRHPRKPRHPRHPVRRPRQPRRPRCSRKSRKLVKKLVKAARRSWKIAKKAAKRSSTTLVIKSKLLARRLFARAQTIAMKCGYKVPKMTFYRITIRVRRQPRRPRKMPSLRVCMKRLRKILVKVRIAFRKGGRYARTVHKKFLKIKNCIERCLRKLSRRARRNANRKIRRYIRATQHTKIIRVVLRRGAKKCKTVHRYVTRRVPRRVRRSKVVVVRQACKVRKAHRTNVHRWVRDMPKRYRKKARVAVKQMLKRYVAKCRSDKRRGKHFKLTKAGLKAFKRGFRESMKKCRRNKRRSSKHIRLDL